MNWTKELALEELRVLLEQCAQLDQSEARSAAHTQWLFRVTRFLEQAFGERSSYLKTFCALNWQATGSFVIQSWDLQRALNQRHHEGYLQDLQTAKGILMAAHEELERSELASMFQGKDTPAESSGLIKLLNLAEAKLRKVQKSAPSKEVEVQDAFESLLIGADMPYSREGESIEYSSKQYVPDFAMKQLDLAIEIKLCHRAGREKEIIAEINDDILAYKQKYGNLLFVVYDVGQIRDTDKFGEQFEEVSAVLVRVVKH